jgi:hypothetical protein
MTDEAPRAQATVSTEVLTRIVIILVAAWNVVAGVALLALHGASRDALGAGVTDHAGQRLLGAHFILLVPIYVLIAVRFQRYLSLIWLPFAQQGLVVLVIGYNMLKGDTGFSDGILAFAVSLIFVTLLGFLWITERRTLARLQMEQEATPPPPSPRPPPSSGTDVEL